MVMGRFLAALLLLSTAVVATPPTEGDTRSSGRPAPGFSSPQAEIAPNGDRVGHYPPYYHPTQ